MEFWGVEVKPGESVKASPEDANSYIHLSQAALGESKKGNESVCLYLKTNEQKMVLGHLSTDKIPQLSFDLVFDDEFELSHNSKNSVFFIGYQSSHYETDSDEDSEDEEMPVQMANAENGVQDTKPAAALASKAVPESSSSKSKSKPVQPVKDSEDGEGDEDDSDDEDDDDSDDSDDSDSDETEEGMSVDGDDSEEEDDSESEEEETPKNVVKAGNKRSNDSAVKTPVSSKKQKAAATPQKTDGKKSVHTATPHPAKAAAKTKANGTDSKQKTPKSGGNFTCSSCEKPFRSDEALLSHTKAKHSAK